MAADVVQVNRQAAFVEPVVAEHVAAKLRRGNEGPIGANRPLKFRRQQGPDEGGCLRQLGRKLLLGRKQSVFGFDQLPLRLDEIDHVQLMLGQSGKLARMWPARSR